MTLTPDPDPSPRPTALPRPPAGSQAIFERLLEAIVGGQHAPGAHLPAERELARQLGASRPTVREALRRLAAWRLVDTRRGSGIRVRPEREWSFHVLPAYLHAALTRPGSAPRLARLVVDMLDFRRVMLVDMLRVVSRRPSPDLAPARAALQRALRARGPDFVREDLEVIRAIVEASGFLPALWMLADLADVYLELAQVVGQVHGGEPPEGYQATYEGVLSALDQGDGERACAQLAGYLERHDGELLRRWGVQP